MGVRGGGCEQVWVWVWMGVEGVSGCGCEMVYWSTASLPSSQLSFGKGELITVTKVVDGGWWEGTCNGRSGWFPGNHVMELSAGQFCFRLTTIMSSMTPATNPSQLVHTNHHQYKCTHTVVNHMPTR